MKTMSKNAGLTLLESMIGLAIFAIVIWAAMANHSSATSSQSASQIAIEIQALRTSVRELYAGQPSYGSSEIITSIIASNRTPRTMAVADGTITNSFGSPVQIIGNDDSFTLEYPALSKPLCIATLIGPASNGWRSVQVGASNQIDLPVSPAQSMQHCSLATNTVIFTGS